MRAMSQRDAVLGHMHRRHVALDVRRDDGLLSLPGLAVILAAVDGQRSGRMVVFHEGQDVTRRLIHRGPTPREPLGDDDFLAPGSCRHLRCDERGRSCRRSLSKTPSRPGCSQVTTTVPSRAATQSAWRPYSLEIGCNWKFGLPRKDSSRPSKGRSAATAVTGSQAIASVPAVSERDRFIMVLSSSVEIWDVLRDSTTAAPKGKSGCCSSLSSTAVCAILSCSRIADPQPREKGETSMARVILAGILGAVVYLDSAPFDLFFVVSRVFET